MSYDQISPKVDHFNQYVLTNLQTQISTIVEELQGIVVTQANKAIREKCPDFLENYENFSVTIIANLTNALRKELNKIDLLKENKMKGKRIVRTTVIRKLHKLPEPVSYASTAQKIDEEKNLNLEEITEENKLQRNDVVLNESVKTSLLNENSNIYSSLTSK